MQTDPMSLVGLSMLILAGGLAGSFGISGLTRSKLGRAFIRRWRWWGLALYYLIVAGVLVTGLGWIMLSLISSMQLEGVLESPWFFLTFGVVVGLPFTLPAVTAVWREHHDAQRQLKAKQKPASRQDRLNFAKDLERQLGEYGDSRTIKVELQGDKGEVLVFRGDITREEGERLVAALRADLETVSIQRVEGAGEKGNWWARV